jgi:hypothetical protein
VIPPRLAAIDVARAVALLGMMAVHILSPGPGLGGTVHELAGGRSAALFAVIAGVGLALGSGGADPDPERLPQARRAIAIRAGLIGAIGLTVSLVHTPAAVILVYYAVLFLLALPVLGWPARRLALLAAVWTLVSPVLSQLIRGSWTRPGPGSNLTWLDLADPVRTVELVLLTGYYPVLTWGSYLFAGLAVGRLALNRPVVARWLVLAGAGVAAAGWGLGLLCVRWAGGVAALNQALPEGSYLSERGSGLLHDSFFGTTPTTSWWWLGVTAPHSGAIPDLLHTTGVAVLVIGLMLLLVPHTGPWLRPLAAAGSMTLTLYCLHVIALGLFESAGDPLAPGALLLVNVVLAVAVAVSWGAPDRRGPLEELIAATIRRQAAARERS